MSEGQIKVYYGEGKGKSTAALGQAVYYAGSGKEVFVIQFLKGKLSRDLDYLTRLEPELKIYRFEKTEEYYNDLSEEEKEEERFNVLNGVNFAKKVLKIGECDVLVLDELLGLMDLGILSEEEVLQMLDMKNESMELILTGRTLPDTIRERADIIFEISVTKPEGNDGGSAE